MNYRYLAHNISFLGCLIREIPALLPLLEEHLAVHEGVLLPHVFMGEIRGWTECDASGTDIDLVASQLNQALESGPDEVRTVILTSFLEDLPEAEDDERGLRARFSNSWLDRSME